VKGGFARAWYDGHPALLLLAPLSLLYALVILIRRQLYRMGLLTVSRFAVPVIVIGNIAVGGTGKTPLALALIERLRRQGFKPGVVSRGYGGRADYPLRVTEVTSPAEAGDEPVMLYRRSGVPLVVDPRRGRAIRHLLQQEPCDVILCDDGLQHYALARDIEIAVVDGSRGFGNGWLLPAGPLREPQRRLHGVDHVVVNGEGDVWPAATRMRLMPEAMQPVAPAPASAPTPGSRCHAVAGIGNPERFFLQLRAQGFEVIPHPFPDHHDFVAADLEFGDGLPVLMTEKDMVKCRHLAAGNWWYLPVSAELPDAFYDELFRKLELLRTTKNAG
jgi:tetraacyldisaccharide 4'-kinase